MIYHHIDQAIEDIREEENKVKSEQAVPDWTPAPISEARWKMLYAAAVNAVDAVPKEELADRAKNAETMPNREDTFDTEEDDDSGELVSAFFSSLI